MREASESGCLRLISRPYHLSPPENHIRFISPDRPLWTEWGALEPARRSPVIERFMEFLQLFLFQMCMALQRVSDNAKEPVGWSVARASTTCYSVWLRSESYSVK